MQTITLVELQRRLDHLDVSTDLAVRYEPVSRTPSTVNEDIRDTDFGQAELIIAAADVFFTADLKDGIELEVCWQADCYGNKSMEMASAAQYALRGAELVGAALEELKLPKEMQSEGVSIGNIYQVCGFEGLRELDAEITPLCREDYVRLLPDGRKNNQPKRQVCHVFGKKPELCFTGVQVAEGEAHIGEDGEIDSCMRVFLLLDGRYLASLLEYKDEKRRSLLYRTGAVCEDLEAVKKFYGLERTEKLNLFPLEKMDHKEHSFLLTVDNQPDILFRGQRFAAVSSSKGDPDRRWTELHLYRTRGGKYVCQRVGKSTLIGEHTRYDGRVCERKEDIIEFFGHSRLAKELYRKANIGDVQIVD